MIATIIGGIVGLAAAFGYYRYLSGVIETTKRNDTKAWTLVASYLFFPVFGTIGALLGRLFFG